MPYRVLIGIQILCLGLLILRIGIMFVGGLGGLLVRVKGFVGDYYLGALGVGGLGDGLLGGGMYSYAGLCRRPRIGSDDLQWLCSR